MYAVIQVGGKQYRVNKGENLVVDHLDDKVGDIVKFPALLVVNDSQVKVGKEAQEIQVSAKVLNHQKDDKIDVYRFRAKSRHRRHTGFRKSLTTLLIESIGNEKEPVSPQKVKTKTSKIKT